MDSAHAIRVSYTQRSFAAGAYDPYEPDIWPLYCQVIQQAKVIYDVGASAIGVYSLAAAVSGAHRVVAFEPAPQNCIRLRENIRLNRLKDIIRVVPNAVSDQNGTVDFYIVQNTDGLHSLAAGLYEKQQRISVPTVSLDSFIEQSREPEPDLIKVDVEGAEVRVMRGLQQTLLKRRPVTVIIELHPQAVQQLGDHIEEIFKIAQNSEMEVYTPGGTLANLQALPKHIILSRSWPPPAV
ncbi:MAG TPA: FkbM family methyltransferase [Aggregatilineaceae bacterium]|nr:FkbM family methyltransferase [Aggregatilineaceae bacterium]